MALQTPTSKNNPGIIVNLGTTDNVRVNAGVALESTAQSCIVGSGSNHVVTVLGTGSVSGTQYGILLGGPGQSNETVTIRANASVDGELGGVRILASESKVDNGGSINSANGFGVYFAGNSSGESLLNNLAAGTIQASTDGVWVKGAEDFNLTNAGAITAANAFNSTGRSDDTIVNTGALNGDVRLGRGDDVYNGQIGTVTGTVFGGRGDDRITCGNGNETIDAGAGDDRVRGNQGADTLRGGEDADSFIFATVNDSAVGTSDTISDFKSADDDIVRLRQIDADTVTAGNQAFTFVGAAAFTGKAGELRADTLGGATVVQGDVNGDGNADFEILFTGVAGMAADDFVL